MSKEEGPEDRVSEEVRREAEGLRAELRRHAHLYYVEARPEISDADYDRLFRRLLELEEAHPEVRCFYHERAQRHCRNDPIAPRKVKRLRCRSGRVLGDQ